MVKGAYGDGSVRSGRPMQAGAGRRQMHEAPCAFLSYKTKNNMRTRTSGKKLLRNCARRSKMCKPLMSEGLGELKWACPLCSHTSVLYCPRRHLARPGLLCVCIFMVVLSIDMESRSNIMIVKN